MNVPFIDLKKQCKEIKKDFNKAINKIVNRGDFILGEDVKLFEEEFSRYCRVKHAVGVNSGTDALFFALQALGIGPGDEIIVPVFTFIATAFAVTYTGAKPVFVDIDENSYNIDVNKIEQAITKRTKAIIPVHLYGLPADMDGILKIAKKYGLKVIEDAAQAHGAYYHGKRTGSLADVGAFSFYPTKNLGALGDGGIVLTDNDEVYKNLLILRDYGRTSRYEHVAMGYNSRLDTLQAAALRLKLKKLDKWNNMRRQNARFYSELLKGIDGIITPGENKDGSHVYHLYVIRAKNRDEVVEALRQNNIAVLIHYPTPLHLQPVYKGLGYKRGDFPAAEKVSDEILSLPMYPHMAKQEIRYICQTIKKAVKQ